MNSRRIEAATTTLWRHWDAGRYKYISCMSRYTISFSRGKTSKKQNQAEMEDGRGKTPLFLDMWPTDDLTASYTVYSIVRKIIISLTLYKYG